MFKSSLELLVLISRGSELRFLILTARNIITLSSNLRIEGWTNTWCLKVIHSTEILVLQIERISVADESLIIHHSLWQSKLGIICLLSMTWDSSLL
jgi:hypothetical protein